MSISMASNVLTAKARAKYGSRLKEEDYVSLLNCSSVVEIAAYLKNNTSYSKFLAGVDENTIHRGQLEAIVSKKHYFDVDLLCEYDTSSGAEFAHYIIFKNCVRLLMWKILSIASDSDFTFFVSDDTAELLSWHSGLDINSIQLAKTYDELIEAITPSEYANILHRFKPKNSKDIDSSTIGTALYKEAYKKAFEACEHTDKKCKKELHDLFGSFIDINNYQRIIRMKGSYNCKSAYISSSLFSGGNIPKKQMKAMVQAENIEETARIFASTYLGKQIKTIEYEHIDELINKFRFAKSRHNIYFSNNAPVVLMSYVFLSEIERSNILHIIEGIRYNMPKRTIENLLIYSD